MRRDDSQTAFKGRDGGSGLKHSEMNLTTMRPVMSDQKASRRHPHRVARGVMAGDCELARTVARFQKPASLVFGKPCQDQWLLSDGLREPREPRDRGLCSTSHLEPAPSATVDSDQWRASGSRLHSQSFGPALGAHRPISRREGGCFDSGTR